MNNILMAAKKNDDNVDSGRSSGKGKAAFDLWLQRGLHQLFDDVANEPIPDELLRLIEDDRKSK